MTASQDDRILLSTWPSARLLVAANVRTLRRDVLRLLRSNGEAEDRIGVRAAHQLAGVLGLFGASQGSLSAARAERLLRGERPLAEGDRRELADLTVTMQAELDAIDARWEALDGLRTTATASSPHVEQQPGSTVTTVLTVGLGDSAALLRRAVAGTGTAVVAVGSAEEATEVLDNRPVDALVMCASTTVELATTRAVLVAAGAQRLPPSAIVLTSRSTTAERVELARLGVDRVLPSSSPPEQVAASVAAVLRDRLRPTRTGLLISRRIALAPATIASLADEGLRVVSLRSTDELWESLDAIAPDLVVLDAAMTTDAVALTCAIRADVRWLDIGLIVAAADVDVVVGRVRRRLSRHRDAAAGALDPETALPTRSVGEAILQRMAATATTAVACVVIGATARSRTRAIAQVIRSVAPADEVVCRWDTDCIVVAGTDVTPTELGRRLQSAAVGSDVAIGVSDVKAAETPPAAVARAAALASTGVVVGAAVSDDDRGRNVDVFIVDDDPVVCDLLVRALEARGFTTYVATDGLVAVEALTDLGGRRWRAKVVVLDVDLPGVSGPDVLRRLGDRGVLATTKVVMLTARAEEAEIVESLRLGAVDHVAKPFSLAVLVQRLEAAIERR